MIRYVTGNLLAAPAEALVNTVNEVGVMGKGIALMFREAFPRNAQAYEEACERGEVTVGRVLVTRRDALMGVVKSNQRCPHSTALTFRYSNRPLPTTPIRSHGVWRR